jgi:signal transduction histidine kinase
MKLGSDPSDSLDSPDSPDRLDSPDSPDPANSIVILVADDDPATRLYVSRELGKQHYRVLTATNGREALAQIQTYRLDMVLLDILMPEVDGYQVLQLLKADSRLRSIPVIMISAAGDIDKVVRCIELGAEDCLVKPLNSVLLKARINAYLERKQLRDQEQAYLHQLQIEKVEAEVAHRAKNAFIANMSHELRTPLNAIMGYSEILQEDLRAEGLTDLISDLNRIFQSGKHLLGLVDGILDLARIESGKMEIYPEEFDIRTLINRIIETLQPLASANWNTIKVDYKDNISMMHTDLNKVRQILWHLIENAIKFTKNGIVTVVVEQNEQPQSVNGIDSTLNSQIQALNPLHSSLSWITFCITDTGIGISQEQQQRIFGAFTQADESSTRKYGGAGLGLTLSQQLCQLLGGSISVESQIGQGSKFTVHLPTDLNPDREFLEENPEAYSNTQNNIQINASSIPNPKSQIPSFSPTVPPEADLILVVDDDRTIRDLLVQRLNQSGYRVVTSWQASEGLRLARELLPGLIILDMQLSGMDSWTVLSALKDDAALAKIPVILQALPGPSPSEQSNPGGFMLGMCDRLTTAEDFKRFTRQLQSFRQSLQCSPDTDSPQTDHVLLIQNDPTSQQILHRLLTKSGWQVISAKTCQAAMAQVDRVQVIVLDLMLPNSFQFLGQLQQTHPTSSIPVVTILTEAPTAFDRQYLQQGINFLLQLSVPHPNLIQQLQNTVFHYLPPSL